MLASLGYFAFAFVMGKANSEAWEPQQFYKIKRSGTGKAILGEPLGILGYSWSNSRNSFHDLINVKNPILGAERLSELVGRQVSSLNSWSFFLQNWGGPRAPDK